MAALKVAVIYICPVASEGVEHFPLACRFASSLHAHPPDHEHDLYIVSNGGEPDTVTEVLFASMNPKFIVRKVNNGWDVGGFLEASRQIKADMLFCLGGPAHFRRRGWLKRIVAAWEQHGPGVYGTLATFEVRPHINTTGFACVPELLRYYPHKVVTRQDRYDFEHGPDALYIRATQMGLPVKLVTWDGIYDLPAWRTPPNIYRRGDQSNCLTFWTHSDAFERADPTTRQRMAMLADRVITT